MRRMNAYSEDPRKKIIEALRRGMTKSEAARTFSVSRSSVKRYARLAEEGRPLAPKKRPGSKPKIDEAARTLLEADVEERPSATLALSDLGEGRPIGPQGRQGQGDRRRARSRAALPAALLPGLQSDRGSLL